MTERRTIGRRLMGASLLLVLVPMLGWWVATDYVEPALRAELNQEQRATFDELRAHTRMRLASVLALSLVGFGLVVRWARREIVAPLESLAGRASRGGVWSAPPEASRPDEIGDLARALDRTIGELDRRASAAQRAVADLGHELRTPLAAIRGAAEILLEEDLSPEARGRFAGNVLTESARLERLVTGLLDLERTRHGSPAPLTLETVAPAAIAAEVGEVCAPLLSRKQLSFSATGSAERRVVTDADRLRRLLFALLENAIKFSPRGEQVAIDLLGDGGRVVIAVRDRGPGIDPIARAALFARSAGADPRGTGLGLAIAHALAASIGAEIEPIDEPAGGTAFHVRLPERPPARV